jgi:hypothetical protein
LAEEIEKTGKIAVTDSLVSALDVLEKEVSRVIGQMPDDSISSSTCDNVSRDIRNAFETNKDPEVAGAYQFFKATFGLDEQAEEAVKQGLIIYIYTPLVHLIRCFQLEMSAENDGDEEEIHNLEEFILSKKELNEDMVYIMSPNDDFTNKTSIETCQLFHEEFMRDGVKCVMTHVKMISILYEGGSICRIPCIDLISNLVIEMTSANRLDINESTKLWNKTFTFYKLLVKQEADFEDILKHYAQTLSEKLIKERTYEGFIDCVDPKRKVITRFIVKDRKDGVELVPLKFVIDKELEAILLSDDEDCNVV